MSYFNGKLNTTEDTLNFLDGDIDMTNIRLDGLSDEASKLEQNVQELKQQVHDAKNSNIYGEKLKPRGYTVSSPIFVSVCLVEI